MRKFTEEHKRKISLANKGKKASKETKRKMSLARSGEKHPMYGKKHTKESKRKMSLSRKGKHKGEENSNWKDGIRVRKDGYVFVYSPNHPHAKNGRYVFKHRLVMEKHLGRYLKPKEVIHHKNEKVDDNRIENLQLFENSNKHLNFHRLELKR